MQAIGNDNGAGIGGGFNGSASNVVINGGSVKATSEYGADIGDGDTGTGTGQSLMPKNSGGQEVQLLEISNSESKTVKIDGTEWKPSNHTANDSSDTTFMLI